MAKKKKNYTGYKRQVSENIVLKEIIKETKIDGCYVEKETRYVIVDADTGEIFDDAQGYGYKTKQKAMAAYNYCKRPKEEFKKDEQKKMIVRKWWKEHKGFARWVEDCAFYAAKDHESFTVKDLEKLMKEEGLELPEGVTYKDMFKYW